jgi:AraC-like DNA-binding protein
MEKDKTFQDDSGYRLHLHEIALNDIGLKWGSYSTPEEKVLSFHPEKPGVISHFRLSNEPEPADKGNKDLPGKQFIVYREPTQSYDLYVSATKSRERSFFELMMSEQFFSDLLTDESDFLMSFYRTKTSADVSFDFVASMTPAMYNIIGEMRNTPYRGYLKGVFLEAKATELFLLQVMQLDEKGAGRRLALKQKDIESLHAVRDYLAAHYEKRCSISGLARQAGINQMKLKSGFKQLFGTTVFSYLTDIRMQEAKRLLLDEKMYVAEVADIMGYSHPHHFTAAFKKKFGLVPKDLRK